MIWVQQYKYKAKKKKISDNLMGMALLAHVHLGHHRFAS